MFLWDFGKIPHRRHISLAAKSRLIYLAQSLQDERRDCPWPHEWPPPLSVSYTIHIL